MVKNSEKGVSREVINIVATEKSEDYVFDVNGRVLHLNKNMVDRYSEIICPVNEYYIGYLIKVFGKDNCEDSILSHRISLDMAQELSGYEQ